LDLEQEHFEEDLERRLANGEILESEMNKLREAYMLNYADKKKEIDEQITKDAKEAAEKQAEIDKALADTKKEGYLAAAEAVLSIADSIFGDYSYIYTVIKN